MVLNKPELRPYPMKSAMANSVQPTDIRHKIEGAERKQRGSSEEAERKQRGSSEEAERKQRGSKEEAERKQ